MRHKPRNTAATANLHHPNRLPRAPKSTSGPWNPGAVIKAGSDTYHITGDWRACSTPGSKAAAPALTTAMTMIGTYTIAASRRCEPGLNGIDAAPKTSISQDGDSRIPEQQHRVPVPRDYYRHCGRSGLGGYPRRHRSASGAMKSTVTLRRRQSAWEES